MATASRAIRKVTIKLGPIMLEAGIHGAIEDDDAGIVRVCTHAGSQQERTAPSRIKRRDYCPVCDQDEVSTFRRAKVVGGGVVLLDPNALQALVEADAATKTSIELTVHPTEQMTRAFPTGKSYYLVPRAGAAGNYALLATLMAKRPDRSFVGEFAFQGAPALYQVQVSDGIIAMRQLAGRKRSVTRRWWTRPTPTRRIWSWPSSSPMRSAPTTTRLPTGISGPRVSPSWWRRRCRSLWLGATSPPRPAPWTWRLPCRLPWPRRRRPPRRSRPPVGRRARSPTRPDPIPSSEEEQ